MQLHFDFLTRLSIQKKGIKSLTDCFFSIIANKHELVHFQQLSKQNYSINQSEILTGAVRKMIKR